jgi:hypothetical protein
MFESREGKQLKKGMLVGIHFNSTRKDFSVVEMKSLRTVGKVIGYISKGILSNGYPLIMRSSQRIVRESKQKNRHAFLVGYWEGFKADSDSITGQVYYNPHKVDSFIDYDLFHNEGITKEINSSYQFHFDLIKDKKEVKPVIKYLL